MILRRIRSLVERPDWLAIAIEFILVVAGVFVGIQAANWNERRKEQTLEAAYLARIAQDARSDVADLDEIIRVSAARMALLNQLLPQASGRALPAGFDSARGRVAIEPVGLHAAKEGYSPGFTLFILSPFDDNRSGYETMISTGAIANMRDTEALRRIQDYYAAVDRELHFEVSLEQNRDKFVDAERKLGISPVKPMTLDQLVAAFRGNPELLATAENYWLYTNRHLKLTRDLQARARRLADDLEART